MDLRQYPKKPFAHYYKIHKPIPLPIVEIIEQPANKSLRFRYECEGRSAGTISGINSTSIKKTYPTIRIRNYKGVAKVVVSCVTKASPFYPHPHNLVGRNTCRDGVCVVEVPIEGENNISFKNMGIQCVKKKDILNSLRIREHIRIDPYKTGFEFMNNISLIDLNAVRLCFQVFIEDSETGKCIVPLKPVVSDPIYDKKAMSDLFIYKLSQNYASMSGGDEIILLCDKISKDDIGIRFFEEKNGYLLWEDFGTFLPSDVHRQVAITFKTPSYKSAKMDRPVDIFIQLYRPSDRGLSEAVPFKLMPNKIDDNFTEYLSRRKRLLDTYTEECPERNIKRERDEKIYTDLSYPNEMPLKLVKRAKSEFDPNNQIAQIVEKIKTEKGEQR